MNFTLCVNVQFSFIAVVVAQLLYHTLNGIHSIYLVPASTLIWLEITAHSLPVARDFGSMKISASHLIKVSMNEVVKQANKTRKNREYAHE